MGRMAHAFEFNPCQVLGVGPQASLQEVRDAYRAKAQKYHPDHGGEEWIFRVIHRSFEILSTARVAARSREAPAPAAPRPAPAPGAAEPGQARPGIRDPVQD